MKKSIPSVLAPRPIVAPKMHFALGNEGGERFGGILPADLNHARSGVMYGLGNEAGSLSNDSFFADAFFSEPLTIYAVDYKDSKIDGAVEALLPAVPASGELFEYEVFQNPQEFMIDTDDARALNAEFKVIEFYGTKQQGKVFNRGLAMIVDLDRVKQEVAWAEKRTGKILRRLKRSELLRGTNVLLTAAGSAVKLNAGRTALTAGNTVWDTNADPDIDLSQSLTIYADTLGFKPNRVYFDAVAWEQRKVALRGNANAGKFVTGNMTPVELAAWLGIDEVLIGEQRYQTTLTTKSRMAPGAVIAFYGDSAPSVEDPSVIKRFTLPTASGGPYRVYQQQLSSKRVLISVEHYSNVIQTATIGAFRMNIVGA